MKPRIMKRNSQFQSSLAGACSVLLVLFASQPGIAQQSPLEKPAAAVASSSTATTASAEKLPAITPLAPQAAAEEKETSAPAKPGGEGIKIHGHWKFEVHDPNGKLVSTREFENGLLTPSQGDFLIATLLLGKAVAADWGIALCPQAGGPWNSGAQPPNYGLCTSASPVPTAVLVQNANGPLESEVKFFSYCGSGCVPGLQALLTGSPNLGNQIGISLSGSYTAPGNVVIDAVETVTAFCDTDANGNNPTNPPYSNLSTQTCLTLNTGVASPGNAFLTFSPFTGTALSSPQALTAGQVLTVTVTISFS
jgi:hypothetical protein